jgi:hypothetical protein
VSDRGPLVARSASVAGIGPSASVASAASVPGAPATWSLPFQAERTFTAAELLADVEAETLSAIELERWLLAEGLATRNGAPGLLVATKRGVELAAGLA